MTTLSRAEDMKVTFTVVRTNDANSEEEETKVHTFAGRATFDDLKTAVGEWFGASQNFTLGFSDEDSDFAVIASQDEWEECLRLHSDAPNEVNVLVRVAEADTPCSDAAEACRKACAVIPRPHHHHHHGKGCGKGKGKGTKRGRSCFERGTKLHASDEDEGTADAEHCKRSRHHEHGSWKGGKGMRGCFDSWAAVDNECAFTCKGMMGKGKGNGKGCRGMKGCTSEDDAECLDMPCKGMKGMKGKGGCKGMKGMLKGMKGMCKGMKGCFEEDTADMPVECDGKADTTAEQEEPSFASWKGGKGAMMLMLMKGMKDHEVDGQLHENDDEACPPFKGGKGALMAMMKGKGMKGGKGGQKGGKAHGEHRCMRGHAGKKGGKFGMHMHGMKGGHRAHTVPMHGPAF